MQRYDLFLIRKIFGDFFRFGLFHLLYTQNGLNLFVYTGDMTDRKKLKVFFEKFRCLTNIFLSYPKKKSRFSRCFQAC